MKRRLIAYKKKTNKQGGSIFSKVKQGKFLVYIENEFGSPNCIAIIPFDNFKRIQSITIEVLENIK